MTTFLNKIAPTLRIVGSSNYDSDWVEPQRFIHDHQLVLFAKGNFDIEFPSQRFEGQEGTYLIVPPGVNHVTRMRTSSGRRCWVHFDWLPPDDNLDRPLISYPPQKVQPDQIFPSPSFVPKSLFQGSIPTLAVLKMHHELEMLWNAGRVHELLLCRGLFLQLLVELLGPGMPPSPPINDSARQKIQIIRDRLDQLAKETIDQTPSIQYVLESLGYSYAHACRMFHAAFGISPLAYTHRLRIERAKLLLRTGNQSVARIGESVGISNPAYFSRLFRNLVGMSPREYVIQSTKNV